MFLFAGKIKFKARNIVPLLFVLTIHSFAQEGTRMTNDKTVSGKVMIIPFEPLMYMSEIDKKVNEQTGWNFEQIRENFRRQLDVKILLKLKTKTNAISFYMDSVKMAKDLEFVYRSRSLAYEPVDPKERNSTPSNKKQKPITNGQLTVEINNDNRFMNAKVINPALLPSLNKKYGAEYFIFINELDMKPNMDAYDVATDSYQRDITVHYTIMDKTKKVISAGVVSVKLSSLENAPKKIVEQAFIPIADHIADQYLSFIKPKDASAK
jgi:hypothetical protein